ncbi:MAG: EamA family transporter RarD [Leptolyngbyaceae cyanobacterium bins.349]|nr:EamA family transporter RarD [Leptolyngbyaceae cyanobacterium bins.349]
MSQNQQRSVTLATLSQSGAFFAFLAYAAWGLFPIYWKFFGPIPAIEVLSHRIIWSMVFLLGILTWQHRGAEFRQLWRTPRKLGWLLLTASLLTVNWGLYIYGVNSDRVVETSLGYFINPLVNVLLGFVVLKERLHWGQRVAVVLATMGVAYFIWQLGTVPWIALSLAVSFALYGLLRKIVLVAPMVGLAIETLWLTPLACLFLTYGLITGTGHFTATPHITLLLIGAGVVTSLPLLWFNNAAKRLRLSTLGFFQYLAPTLQLLLGVFLYHEPFTRTHVITFGCIWLALLTYSITSLTHPAAQVHNSPQSTPAPQSER